MLGWGAPRARLLSLSARSSEVGSRAVGGKPASEQWWEMTACQSDSTRVERKAVAIRKRNSENAASRVREGWARSLASTVVWSEEKKESGDDLVCDQAPPVTPS